MRDCRRPPRFVKQKVAEGRRDDAVTPSRRKLAEIAKTLSVPDRLHESSIELVNQTNDGEIKEVCT
jgi:hypothetical protein